MRKHRFFLPVPLNTNQSLDLDKDLSHQIIHVLRLTPGNEIFFFNNSGFEFTAKIADINRKIVSVNILDSSSASVESPCQINLGQVLGKGEKMDVVIQKATELGVHSITPLFSEHTVIRNVADRITNKQEHWQKIANAACCQCGRNVVPVIHPAQDLTTWINNNTDQLKLLLSPSNTAIKLSAVPLISPVSILIGPEGGFSDAEIQLASKHNFTHVSLGPRILRTETAGIAVIAILQSLIGDL